MLLFGKHETILFLATGFRLCMAPAGIFVGITTSQMVPTAMLLRRVAQDALLQGECPNFKACKPWARPKNMLCEE